jgi:hypothetical protein
MSKSESGNKAQKLNPSSTNLLTILRHKGDVSTHILQEIAESLSMDKVGNLMRSSEVSTHYILRFYSSVLSMSVRLNLP